MAIKLKEYFIKHRLRKKYANQLKRNYELSIHTVEGHNDAVRVNYSKNLIDRGIEPTEENLQKFQEELEVRVKEIQKKFPPKSVPVSYIKNPSQSA